MIKIPFKIMNKRWTIRLLAKKKYNKKNGKDSVAIAKLYKRVIDLSPDGCDLETLIHELIHGYISESCLSSSTLTVDALEEVFAELMAKRGRELLDLADTLLDTVNKLREESLNEPPRD